MRPLALALAFSILSAQETPLPATPVSARDQARSMIVSKYGIVAAPQYLASQAGAKILEAGGNAVDAAIAANAMTGLTQPYVNGIGGDLFAIYYEAKSGKLYGLNSSGWTPKALTTEYLKSKGIDKIDPIGVHAITVPGAVAGWDALRKRFGTMPFSRLLAPAIYYAENGFSMPEWGAKSWISDKLLKQPGYTATYQPGGVTPELGDTFKNPSLGESFRQIAAKGRDAYYKGSMTENMVKFLQAQGGTHTKEDFAEYEPEWVDPISTTYRGWKIYELPPNGQGVAALSMLNIMESFPIGDYGPNSTAALHVMIEAKKLAYADMAHYVGDPRFTAVPVAAMLSKELAAKRAQQIQMDKASCKVLPSEISQSLNAKGRETIYLSVVDKDGNIVSLIQSNYAGYGTGMVAPGAGFSFHNRGAGFELSPDKPNTLMGRKRPLHTIIPAFMQKDDITIGFGIMGGWNQSQAHAQFVANIVDFKMNVQMALESARFTKLTFEGCDVQMETRIPESVRLDLQKRGHLITPLPGFSSTVGNGEAVLHDKKRGVNFAGADPRTDSAAVAQLPAIP
ncbi:gamma-glutamyltransferase [Bryobacter aggregatus]|uniref:gamma-glutamyltransferase n=1 Tax=Bryobacter aggregatus TaxID=360054 RepID=UPI0004E1EFF5|nr:gamma-glutamyltransferase [Bryobacter aggregatus]